MDSQVFLTLFIRWRLSLANLAAIVPCVIIFFPGAVQGQAIQTLHPFTAVSGALLTNVDGANPAGDLVLDGRTLYGTTSQGGTFGAGSIFRIGVDGTGFTNLYSFSAPTGPSSTNFDGVNPLTGLILSGEQLFGTTSYGGLFGAGTVFSIHIDGTGFTNLHSFAALSGLLFANEDGAHPQGTLAIAGNTLYGSARDGGVSGNGAIFAINRDGTGFTNLHSFSPAYSTISGVYTNADGANPFAGLTLSSSMLYGTVVYGGRSGQGAIFALNTNGTGFVTLHDFAPMARAVSGLSTNQQGANPAGTLLLLGDTLFGVAQNGGVQGVGTAFSVATNGSSFKTLHTFSATSDGANPVSSLFVSGQTLFGTTSYGGGFGNGTVYAMTLSGSQFTNLHYFGAVSSQTNLDGANPAGGVVLLGNRIYGTTYYGAAFGKGSIYSLTLPTPTRPWLTITRSGSDVILSWPMNAVFKLQSTSDLGNPNSWTNAGPAITTGSQTVFTNPISASQIFFRLGS